MLAKTLVGQPQQAIEFAKRINVDPARRDELTTSPIFNYSHGPEPPAPPKFKDTSGS